MSSFEGNIIINGRKHRISGASGESVLDALRRGGIGFSSPCGGNGTCGKCKAPVTGAVSPMEARERAFLTEPEVRDGVRLCCMCRILGDFTVVLDRREMGILTEYSALSYTASPLVRAVRDGERTAYFCGERCIDIARQDSRNLGIAVDVGTTTVALYLCELDRGTVIGSCGFPNPQGVYGADVISRVDKIMKNSAALSEEQNLLLRAVEREAGALCESAGASLSDVRAAVLCGNTVMEHIAAGIDPSSIAVAPFHAPTLFGEIYEAAALGFLENKGAVVYFAPCFASYVGGDIACGVIATGLDQASDNVLFLDVGTNGEIGLLTDHRLHFCSAAAGPAFEGAHIACGMAGVTGAISAVELQDGRIVYKTIGGGRPVGICGSGILDAAAVMLRTGLLDETGRIVDIDEAGDYADHLAEDENGDSLFLLDADAHIYLSGKDIREVQLAKAAIAAGIRTLCHQAGIAATDISRVILAGGFGSHMNPASACRIGLVPAELEGKIVSAGNTAGAGAVAVLLGEEPRRAALHIRENADYTELSQSSYFMEKYIEEMMFEV